jgi:hypothetical protein
VAVDQQIGLDDDAVTEHSLDGDGASFDGRRDLLDHDPPRKIGLLDEARLTGLGTRCHQRKRGGAPTGFNAESRLTGESSRVVASR